VNICGIPLPNVGTLRGLVHDLFQTMYDSERSESIRCCRNGVWLLCLSVLPAEPLSCSNSLNEFGFSVFRKSPPRHLPQRGARISRDIAGRMRPFGRLVCPPTHPPAKFILPFRVTSDGRIWGQLRAICGPRVIAVRL